MSLLDKKQKYLELLPTVQDKYGFIEHTHCDSLIFTGLLGCTPEVNNIDIWAAYNSKEGMWHRRCIEKPCYPEHSGSTISRDQLLGLAWYAWHNRRLDISENIINRAMNHFGVMGKGDLSRINIMPPLFATFCWISYALGGPARLWAMWIPADFGVLAKGYQAHLQVLHILLRRDIQNFVYPQEKQILKKQAERQPNNPLFRLAVGDYLHAEAILENEDYWPSNRLPTGADRKEPWLPQRDYGADWLPSIKDKDIVHSGGDFLFCLWLLQKYKGKYNV